MIVSSNYPRSLPSGYPEYFLMNWAYNKYFLAARVQPLSWPMNAGLTFKLIYNNFKRSCGKAPWCCGLVCLLSSLTLCGAISKQFVFARKLVMALSGVGPFGGRQIITPSGIMPYADGALCWIKMIPLLLTDVLSSLFFCRWQRQMVKQKQSDLNLLRGVQMLKWHLTLE